MEPEVTTLSKPETKKDKYHVNSLTCGSKKVCLVEVGSILVDTMPTKNSKLGL